jgi:hypothetical protein
VRDHAHAIRLVMKGQLARSTTQGPIASVGVTLDPWAALLRRRAVRTYGPGVPGVSL